MAVIKLKKSTVEVIDKMFEIVSDDNHESMPEEDWLEWTEKFVNARMDWQGYKTFYDL